MVVADRLDWLKKAKVEDRKGKTELGDAASVRWAMLVDLGRCIGCHSCALACPFGVPRYDQDEKMQKCTLCMERVEMGLEPACVRVCPMGALKFESANKIQEAKESKFVGNIVNVLHKAAARK